MRARLILVAIACLMLGAAACDDNGSTGAPASSSPSATIAPFARKTATPAPEGTRADGAVESPEAALRRQIDLLNSGGFAAEWDELHPAQQAVVAREQFVDCQAPNDFKLTVDIIETQDALINVPAVSRAPAKVIAVRLTSGNETLDRNFFEVLVDGRWRWVLEQAQFDAYRAGTCP